MIVENKILLTGACNPIKKETLAQAFPCEFCKISKSTFLTEHLWWLLLKKLHLKCLTGFQLTLFHTNITLILFSSKRHSLKIIVLAAFWGTLTTLTHLFPMHPFSTPWKYLKTIRCSDVFSGLRKGALGTNGLTV